MIKDEEEEVKTEEALFEKDKKEFFYNGYKEFLQSENCIEEFSKFNSKLKMKEKEQNDKNSKIEKELSEFSKLYEDLNSDNQNDLSNLKSIHEIAQKEYEIENEIFSNNVKIASKNENLIKEKENEYQQKIIKQEEIKAEIESTENIVTNQKVSFQEYEMMQQTKLITDKQITVLQQKKHEVGEKLGQFTNSRVEISFKLEEKMKEIKNCIEKVPEESTSNFISEIKERLERTIEGNLVEIDEDKIKNDYQVRDNMLQTIIQSTSVEIRDKEDCLLKLKSDNLLLEDKKNELEIKLQSTENLYTKTLKTIEIEKEKRSKVTKI